MSPDSAATNAEKNSKSEISAALGAAQDVETDSNSDEAKVALVTSWPFLTADAKTRVLALIEQELKAAADSGG